MKRKNRLIIALILVLSLLSLTACGEESPFIEGAKEPAYMPLIEAVCDAANQSDPSLMSKHLYTISGETFRQAQITRAITHTEDGWVSSQQLPLTSKVLTAQEWPERTEEVRRELYQFAQKDVPVETVMVVTLDHPTTPELHLMKIEGNWYVLDLE